MSSRGLGTDVEVIRTRQIRYGMGKSSMAQGKSVDEGLDMKLQQTQDVLRQEEWPLEDMKLESKSRRKICTEV